MRAKRNKVKQLDGQTLLDKNPEARQVFEKNKEKIDSTGRVRRSKDSPEVVSPYGSRGMLREEASRSERELGQSYYSR